jgi:YbbR domain-containing protein
MRKKLLSNWGWKIISLLLACGLWLIVMYEENPPDVATFDNIEVELLNTKLLTDDNKVYSILDGSNVVRRVTVEATRDVLSDIKSSDIRATANMENLTATDTVAIDFSVPSFGIGSADVNGSIKMVKLSIEDRKQKYLTVRVVTEGEVAEGYELESTNLTRNNRITIAGAASIVDAASYATTTVNISDASINLSMESDIEIFDAEGNKLDTSSLEMSANSVQVAVQIFATKTVPISFSVMGEPADGYLQSGEAECVPSQIKIAGLPSTLSGITEIIIPEGDIDITEQTQTYQFVSDIEAYLPDGVKLAKDRETDQVTITIPIEREQSRHMNVQRDNILINHVPEGYVAELEESDTSFYPIVVHGLRSTLDQLVSGQVTGTMDIEEWIADSEITQLRVGTYSVPVELNLPNGIELTEPLMVNIVISAGET